MAFIVCKLLGLSSEETEKIHIDAYLHDIGKIGVLDAVLNKSAEKNLGFKYTYS